MLPDPRDDETLDAPHAPGDAAAARLLDERAAAESFANLDGAERLRAADVQWLHSLLQQALHRDAVARERRITRAGVAIAADAARVVQPASSGRLRRRWVLPITVAAALVCAAVLYRGPINPPRTALAAVQTTLKAAQSPSDRTYRIDTVMQPRGGSTRQLTGELWVRGDTHYLLRQEAPLGQLLIGGNGREHWLVPPLGPVIVSAELNRFQQLLEGKPLVTPFLQVTSLLERLADRYDLTLAPEEELAAVEGTGTVRCTHVVGKLRDADDRLSPAEIELWTARQSGTAYRVLARWTPEADRPGPQQMQLQWVPLPEPLATDWYDHAAHHPADRRVIRRGGEEAVDFEI
jgi:hypothetical protein